MRPGTRAGQTGWCSCVTAWSSIPPDRWTSRTSSWSVHRERTRNRRAGMRSWWAALRIARREVGRAKGRAVMVVAMIAVPVAALAFAAVTYDTFTLSPQERADRAMGSAQAAVRWPQDTAVHQTTDGHTFYPASPQQQESARPGPAPAAPTLDRMLA